MKTLFILRHAKSSWDNPELSDHDRPLNNRGKKNAPEMGKRLRKKEILPDLLLSSTAVRAFSTAKKVANEVGYPKSKIIETRELYHAEIEDLMDIVRMQNDSVKSLMIVGHNPGLTDFANYVADAGINNIPTAGIVAVRFPIELWYQVKPQSGIVLFFDYPKRQQEE